MFELEHLQRSERVRSGGWEGRQWVEGGKMSSGWKVGGCEGEQGVEGERMGRGWRGGGGKWRRGKKQTWEGLRK